MNYAPRAITQGESIHMEDLPINEQECPTGTDAAALEESESQESRAAKRRRLLPLAITLTLIVSVICILISTLSLGNLPREEQDIMFSRGLVPVVVTFDEITGDRTMGYADKNGQLVIAATFAEAYHFSGNGLAAVMTPEGKWGFINKNGEFAIEPVFDDVLSFDNSGLAAAERNGLWGYVNKSGKFVINPQFDEAGTFASNGLALAKINSKYGYINTDGVYIIEPKYKGATAFDENGLASVYDFGAWGMIDEKGKWAINPQFDSEIKFGEDGIALVRQNKKYGYIDLDGIFVVEPTYEDAKDFRCGRAAVMIDGKWGYIDRFGDLAIAAEFYIADDFDECGLARAKVGSEDLFGFINKDGDWVLTPIYTRAWSFKNGAALVEKEDGTRYYLNKRGKPIANAYGTMAAEFTSDGYVCFYKSDEGTFLIGERGGDVTPFGFKGVRPKFKIRSYNIYTKQ